MSFFSDTFMIFRRQLRLSLRNPAWVVIGLIQPVLYLVFFGPLLMILFRQKYPRWWFDWNLELQRFGNRVGTYLALMNDSYPSTDDHQWVELAAGGVERIHRGVDAQRRNLAIEHDSRIQVGEGGRRRRIRQVIGGHIDRLHRGHGTLLGGSNPLLQFAHLRGQVGLVPYC